MMGKAKTAAGKEADRLECFVCWQIQLRFSC